MHARRAKRQWDSARLLYILAGVVFFSGILLLAWFSFWYVRSDGVRLDIGSFIGNDRGADMPRALQAPCPERRILDGVCVATRDAANPRLVAVMIEHSKDAWPLSGIVHASVVYEAPTESNIPRLLAIFPADVPGDAVGPVRSIRPYFLDWFGEYGTGTPLLHVGGSDEALALGTKRRIFDIDEMTRGRFFWRSGERSMPHNTYTKSDLWQEAIRDLGADRNGGAIVEQLFATSSVVCAASCATRVRVAFSSPLYVAEWEYDTASGRYLRRQNGDAFRDAAGTQIAANTVMVMRVAGEVIDEIGRKRITTIGGGSAMIFYDGRAIAGRWRKRGVERPIEWLDAEGSPIPLKPGQRWIEVAPSDVDVAWE